MSASLGEHYRQKRILKPTVTSKCFRERRCAQSSQQALLPYGTEKRRKAIKGYFLDTFISGRSVNSMRPQGRSAGWPAARELNAGIALTVRVS